MTSGHLVITLIATIIGSGGISAMLATMLSARKYRAEARLIEQQAEAARKDSESRMNEYISTQLKDLAETHKKESEDLRKRNKELSDRVNVLTAKLNAFMNWIVIDNNRYVTWAETKLKEYDPNITFPPYKPAPSFDSDDSHEMGITE